MRKPRSPQFVVGLVERPGLVRIIQKTDILHLTEPLHHRLTTFRDDGRQAIDDDASSSASEKVCQSQAGKFCRWFVFFASISSVDKHQLGKHAGVFFFPFGLDLAVVVVDWHLFHLFSLQDRRFILL